MDLRARKANHKDCALLFRWANDLQVLNMSFIRGTIPFDTYAKWFSSFLMDKDTLLLIIEGFLGGAWHPISQVRLHSDGEISMSIASEYRGLHLATPVILCALDFARGNFPVKTVIAHIRHENTPSIKAFEKAGFSLNGQATVKGQACLEYTLEL